MSQLSPPRTRAVVLIKPDPMTIIDELTLLTGLTDYQLFSLEPMKPQNHWTRFSRLGNQTPVCPVQLRQRRQDLRSKNFYEELRVKERRTRTLDVLGQPHDSYILPPAASL
ncbi:hypothetical protein GOODEAATRI_033675 [Goodea atripinnis]|uniref:Nucleoside diphosphate kinase-like domain-containing protein n=1 Tax=Goodea atripinnis TaxID=208336 RepID=A0ABV0Q376_9TELE